MKKTLIMFSIFMFGQFVYGQENLDLNELFTTSQMPTDAEIMQVVDKYNFTS